MLGDNGKTPKDEYFVFYNNLQSPDGSVVHQGDNKTGEGENIDDETIFIDFSKIDSKIQELVVVVTINEAIERGQNFGQISNSFIRLYDVDTKEEITKFELDEDFSNETSVEFGRLYRRGDNWKFKAVGVGYNSGLESFLDKFVY
jgi:tellurium resistance protein TerD